MDSYKSIFDKRGHDYNSASQIASHARKNEIDQLLALAKFENESKILDIPAGGGVVANRIKEHNLPYHKIFCVEPSSTFASAIPNHFDVLINSIDDVKLASHCSDIILSLAGLHHCKDRQTIYSHWHSLLKKMALLLLQMFVKTLQRGHF